MARLFQVSLAPLRILAGWLAGSLARAFHWSSGSVANPLPPPPPPRPARTFTEEAVITNWQGHAAPKEPSQALEGSPLGPHSNPLALAHSEAEREMIQCDVTRRA